MSSRCCCVRETFLSILKYTGISLFTLVVILLTFLAAPALNNSVEDDKQFVSDFGKCVEKGPTGKLNDTEISNCAKLLDYKGYRQVFGPISFVTLVFALWKPTLKLLLRKLRTYFDPVAEAIEEYFFGVRPNLNPG